MEFIINLIPCCFLAYFFYQTWQDPLFQNSKWLKVSEYLLIIEFVMLHSGVFMGLALGIEKTLKKIGAFIGLGLFYSFFAVAISLGFKDWTIFSFYLLVVVSRLFSAFLRDSKKTMTPQITRSFIGAFICMFWMIVSFQSMAPEGGDISENSVVAAAQKGVLAKYVFFYFISLICLEFLLAIYFLIKRLRTQKMLTYEITKK